MRLMVEATSCPPVINVGSGHSTSVNALMDVIRQETQLDLDVEHVELPHAYVDSTCADLTVARTALGFEPRVSLREGIREVHASFLAQESR